MGRGENDMREAKLVYDLDYDAGLESLRKLKGLREEEIINYLGRIYQEILVLGFYLQPAVGESPLRYSFWIRFISEIKNLIARMILLKDFLNIDLINMVSR
jgi:hypothetical protein